MVSRGVKHPTPGWWLINSLLLKMAIEIVDLPIDSMVSFHSFLYVYQRVYGFMVFVLVNSNNWLDMMWLIYLTGCWFGTMEFYDFPFSWEFHDPN